MGPWDYNYNTFGELTWQRDAKLQVTTLGYDKLGRLLTRNEPDTGTTTYEYDTGFKAIGKLSRVTVAGAFEEEYLFDSFGRLQTTKRSMEGQYFWIDQTYDSQSRADIIKYPNSVSTSTSSSAGPDADRLRVRHNYNSVGYLASVTDVASGEVHWEANEVDVLGNVKKETLGNDLITQRTFIRASGHLNVLKTGTAANATSVQHMEFGFDQAANVRIRKDLNSLLNGGNGAREEFEYDKLHRLTQTRLYNAHGASTPTATENYTYDVFGNLTSKGTYSSYQYGARPNCTNQVVRPHAVYELTVGGSTRRYCYDANGNLASAANAAYDTVTWWTANLARKVSKGSQYSEFWYGPDRARYKQVAHQDASNQTTTLYVGALYENLTKVVSGSTTTEHVHYIRGGSQVIAIWKRVGAGTPTASYLHRDHLGSVVAITDGTGSPSTAERFSFDPWGKRRNRDNWAAVAPGAYPSPAPIAMPRGYTGHEHVDALGIVHMNGRIYDAEIGKFLSADPFVQFPESTQGINRYSYVDNNPLSYTDPSGFFKFKDFLMMAATVVIGIISGNVALGIWNQAGLGVSAMGQTLGAAMSTFVSGFVSGMVSPGGNLSSAFRAGLFSALTFGLNAPSGGGGLLASLGASAGLGLYLAGPENFEQTIAGTLVSFGVAAATSTVAEATGSRRDSRPSPTFEEMVEELKRFGAYNKSLGDKISVSEKKDGIVIMRVRHTLRAEGLPMNSKMAETILEREWGNASGRGGDGKYYIMDIDLTVAPEGVKADLIIRPGPRNQAFITKGIIELETAISTVLTHEYGHILGMLGDYYQHDKLTGRKIYVPGFDEDVMGNAVMPPHPRNLAALHAIYRDKIGPPGW